MKSEHRHELQTNELGKMTEKLTTFAEVHGNRLMIVVCALSVAASAGIWLWRSKQSGEASAWRLMAAAEASNKPEDFFDVWDAHPGTTTGLWARVHEGESRLTQAVQTLFRDVEAGRAEVDKARAAFQAVVDDRRAPHEVRERALIGLGRALESGSEGSATEAIKAYETLVKEFPDSLYKQDAQDRISVLSKGSGQEFYAWFAKYTRPKPSEKRPHDKIGGDSTDEQAEQAELIEKLKKISGDRAPGEDEKSPELPAPDKKKADDAKSGESKADDGKPDDAESDKEGKPADSKGEKPAADAPTEPPSKSKGESEPKPDPVPEPESKAEGDAKPSSE